MINNIQLPAKKYIPFASLTSGEAWLLVKAEQERLREAVDNYYGQNAAAAKRINIATHY